MDIETYLALLAFALTSSISPGPNNLMLLASGVNFGFVRTIPHIVGIEAGFSGLILAVGLGLGVLFAVEPRLYIVLKVIGGSYLLWMAWKIATTREMGRVHGEAKPFSFWQAAGFQFVNPKAWVMAIGANTAFADPEHYVFTTGLVCLAFLSVGFFTTGLWTVFGTTLKVFLSDSQRLKWFNITMAVLLVLSLWPMLA
ncbi:LysE family translocator [Rhizobium sp. L1K21]|uniref:LysE family translocator n=1 Tax=Rhizobium sp. L1K21 TaxID=2954933 RepID=UPI00209379BB|nr:LysE family translocator [Rhizobium sp. L1K21]MCO6185715.1 LysE family translocator [Rhizobium sp. L1K21]